MKQPTNEMNTGLTNWNLKRDTLKLSRFPYKEISREIIKLNLPCSICNKDILIGNGTIIKNEPMHFNCFKKQTTAKLKQDVFRIIDEKIKNAKQTRDSGKITDNMYSFMDGLIRNLEELKQKLNEVFK